MFCNHCVLTTEWLFKGLGEAITQVGRPTKPPLLLCAIGRTASVLLDGDVNGLPALGGAVKYFKTYSVCTLSCTVSGGGRFMPLGTSACPFVQHFSSIYLLSRGVWIVLSHCPEPDAAAPRVLPAPHHSLSVKPPPDSSRAVGIVCIFFIVVFFFFFFNGGGNNDCLALNLKNATER